MTSRSTKSKLVCHNYMFRTIFLLLPMLIGIQSLSIDNPQQGTSRTIVSDDFTRNRQESPSSGAASKSSQGKSSKVTPPKPQPNRRRTYRLASKPATKKQPTRAGAVVAQLGVTIWKLREIKGTSSGARVLVREKGKSSSWVPERVHADTIFRGGDRVRLTIESPRAGYLYVLDRDLFADGTTGGAMLIYPWANMHGGDNRMLPGKLVDIPAQEDNPSYFTARPKSPEQVGEILTVIITDSPLDLPISDEPFQISNTQLALWEKMWGGESDRFEMEGGAGEAWTAQEQQASAGSGSRQLTRDDPGPQTIYQLSPADNKAILVNVRLRYGK